MTKASNASPGARPPAIILPRERKVDPKLSGGIEVRLTSPPTLTVESDPTANGLSLPQDSGASISRFPIPDNRVNGEDGSLGGEDSGLDVRIPTSRLVSRPTSPSPSLLSQIDTDSSASSGIRSREGNEGLSSAKTGEDTPEGEDGELETRMKGEEARRVERERQREEARKLEQSRDLHQCWNFQLPVLPARKLLQLDDPDAEWEFDIQALIYSIQRGAKAEQVKVYLERCSKSGGSVDVNRSVEKFPAMFYAVESNKERLVRIFVQYGGDMKCLATYRDCHRIPLLAFAVINALKLDRPTTAMVATLLSLGATADVIPKAFYDPFFEDLPINGPSKDKITDLSDLGKSWCESKETRKSLARALDLTQRYYLYKSTMIPQPGPAHRQITRLYDADPLWEVPYLLIGQIAAAAMVTERMVTNLVIPSKKPMVLVFAGPSGHGKTELARKLKDLLSLDMLTVDCTTFSSESGLFGPRTGIVGNERGSKLNNFLSTKDGQRAIVFMDEFEKTNSSVHNALLIPFDNGEYEDRRSGNMVDCSKVIWVLATNAVDSTILRFCEENQEVLHPTYREEAEKRNQLKNLCQTIQSAFKDRFDPPLTGRITAFVPFLPFAPGEQAVGAHKYILEFVDRARAKVVMNPCKNEPFQPFGNVRLRIPRDASLCTHLAASYYQKDLGIRSLKNSVEALKNEVVQEYLRSLNKIEETNALTDFVVDLDKDEITVTRADRHRGI